MLHATHRSNTRLGGRVVFLLLMAAAVICALPTLYGAGAPAPAAEDKPAGAASAVSADAPRVKDEGAKKPDLRQTLRYDGKGFDQWQSELQTELKLERRIEAIRALEAFGRAGLVEEAVAAIKSILEADQGNLSRVGYSALANLEPSGVDPLLKGLKSDRASTRLAAAGAWFASSEHAKTPEQLVAALMEATTDSHAGVRQEACSTLTKIADRQREYAGRVVQLLAKRLDDEDFRVRSRAIACLGSLKSEAAALSLVKFIESTLHTGPGPEDEDGQRWFAELRSAVSVLGDIGPAARSAIPVLEKIRTPELRGSNPQLYDAAFYAMQKISRSGTSRGARPAPAAPAKSEAKAAKPVP